MKEDLVRKRDVMEENLVRKRDVMKEDLVRNHNVTVELVDEPTKQELSDAMIIFQKIKQQSKISFMW